MTEPTDPSRHDDDTPPEEDETAALVELDHDPHTRAEIRHARRAFLMEAAIEAERDTGRRERTDEEARHSLWMRVARLVGGWILVLLGLAAIPLPGPGWLMVLLGLTLLPYRWTDNLIREIRRRIPGIPEDGRIPTRTWIITGVLVVAATAGSVWWGMRDAGDDEPAKGDRVEQAAGASASDDDGDGASAGDGPGPTIVVASSAQPERVQLAQIYGEVAATVTDGVSDHIDRDDTCAALTSGDADLVLLDENELSACFGGETDQAARLRDAGVKMYAPVVAGATTFFVTVRSDAIAIDDEPAELTLDGVSSQISAGQDVAGDPADRARQLMAAAGVLK